MIKIKNLVGHNQVDIACQCLGTLLANCQDDVTFVIHDDGTLEEGDIQKLNRALGNPEIIDRKSADHKMSTLLKNFPACLKYREKHPLALKLFDICLLHDSEETLYFCDSDVLFLRPFKFPVISKSDTAIFMQDSHQAFSLRPWDLKPFGPLSIGSKVNTGLIITHSLNLDLNYIEKLLSDPKLQDAFEKRPHWIEQTCWALLATRLSTFLFDRSQICLASDKTINRESNLVAIHFVSSHRDKIGEYSNQQSSSSEVCELKLNPLVKAMPWDLFYSDISRRFNFG